ncbi:rod shape-determining protein MreD [Flavobacteriales bacterium]|jgi:rod shape-determining protein MreD|nr:rod shape-determining protein MreD [Flavobacteriales bacterium]MDB2622364.1 rod shape-determining protein MreD [Flavobacteriales bacterium]
MNKAVIHIKRFFILLGIQIIVLNNVQISGYLNPYIYILFIMLLPPKMPKALVLTMAFIMGFTVDIFENSYGIHAAASVLIAFIRPVALSLVSVKGGEDLEAIGIKQLRFARFFTYSGILCLIHHFTLFYIEAFRLNEFIDTFVRALSSTLISLLIILLMESVRSNSHK